MLKSWWKAFTDGWVIGWSPSLFSALLQEVKRGKESDLDVMVVCEKLPKNRLDRTELFIECEKDLDKILDTLYERGYGVSISPIILTPQEAARIPSILLDMTGDAVILYDKDSFLTNLLNSLRVNLEKMGAERVWIGREWYWRLWKGGGVKRVKINGQSGDGKSNLRQAEKRLTTAKTALQKGSYAYAVRLCQECVEFSLKAALRLVGVELPKWHDVGPILRREKSRFPSWMNEQIDELASISRALRKERETAMYGGEELNLPPEEIYAKIDAEKALSDTEKVFEAVRKLMNSLQL